MDGAQAQAPGEDADVARGLHPVVEVLRRRHAEGSRPGSRTDPHRVVLALEGGGARGAVSGGMTLALHELGLVDAFDGLYGSSAGALNAVWLLAPDPAVGLRTWTDEGFQRAYANARNPLRRRPFVDVRMLIEGLYETRAPLDWDAVLAHPVSLHPLATDVATGRAVDLAPHITDKRSLQLALRATCTIPLLGGRPVAIGGGHYLDAGLAESIPFRAALDAGATHVLVLRSRRAVDADRPGAITSAITSWWLKRHGEPVRDAYRSRPARLAEADAELDRFGLDHDCAPSVLSIRAPDSSPHVGRLESDFAAIEGGMRAGHEAAIAALRGTG
ncbi:MAG: patatin-like phospholipase family protein [Solirubrobacteraceae bacterium]